MTKQDVDKMTERMELLKDEFDNSYFHDQVEEVRRGIRRLEEKLDSMYDLAEEQLLYGTITV